MSHTHPHEAHHVKKGQYIMLKGHPCKIVDVKTSKTGKHGHAKCNITGIDVFSAKKYNEVHPGHIVLAAFDLSKNEYEVANIDVDDNEVSYMDENGNEHTCKIPEGEIGEKLVAEFKANEEAGGDKFWIITIQTAPEGETDPKLKSEVIEFKEGKE